MADKHPSMKESSSCTNVNNPSPPTKKLKFSNNGNYNNYDGDLSYLHQRGCQHFKAREYSQALNIFQKVLNNNNNRSHYFTALYNIALIFMTTNQSSSSKGALELLLYIVHNNYNDETALFGSGDGNSKKGVPFQLLLLLWQIFHCAQDCDDWETCSVALDKLYDSHSSSYICETTTTTTSSSSSPSSVLLLISILRIYILLQADRFALADEYSTNYLSQIHYQKSPCYSLLLFYSLESVVQKSFISNYDHINNNNHNYDDEQVMTITADTCMKYHKNMIVSAFNNAAADNEYIAMSKNNLALIMAMMGNDHINIIVEALPLLQDAARYFVNNSKYINKSSLSSSSSRRRRCISVAVYNLVIFLWRESYFDQACTLWAKHGDDDNHLIVEAWEKAQGGHKLDDIRALLNERINYHGFAIAASRKNTTFESSSSSRSISNYISKVCYVKDEACLTSLDIVILKHILIVAKKNVTINTKNSTELLLMQG